jgi:hypothetical protein
VSRHPGESSPLVQKRLCTGIVQPGSPTEKRANAVVHTIDLPTVSVGEFVEPRYKVVNVLGALMDGGPQTTADLKSRLFPNGTQGRRQNRGEQVLVTSSALQKKLDSLRESKHVRVRIDDRRYELHPDLGTVWVIYVGNERVYVGIYDATLAPLKTGNVDALRVVEHGGMSETTSHRTILSTALDALAGLVGVDAFCRPPGAVVLGLPASLSLTNDRVAGEAPVSWRSENLPSLDAMLVELWSRKRRQRQDLPDLPRTPDGRLRLTADSDVVLDALGAMYDPAQIGAERPAPRRASVVLAIKHARSIRSTVVSRGPADLMRPAKPRRGRPLEPPRRRPGERRDHVWRGAFGDTIGLGHSIALIHRATRVNPKELESDERWADVMTYYAGRVKADRPCSCGIIETPHLTSVGSYPAVLERLRDVADVAPTPEMIWDGVDELVASESPAGARARAVLEETGRLTALAIDVGVRLYDPEAVLVTGMMPFNQTFWDAVKETANVSQHSERRVLERAVDLPGDDVNRPIGPRGAAWLGFDTWVFPSKLAEMD